MHSCTRVQRATFSWRTSSAGRAGSSPAIVVASMEQANRQLGPSDCLFVTSPMDLILSYRAFPACAGKASYRIVFVVFARTMEVKAAYSCLQALLTGKFVRNFAKIRLPNRATIYPGHPCVSHPDIMPFQYYGTVTQYWK